MREGGWGSVWGRRAGEVEIVLHFSGSLCLRDFSDGFGTDSPDFFIKIMNSFVKAFSRYSWVFGFKANVRNFHFLTRMLFRCGKYIFSRKMC